jgi:hypothetical protein
LTQSASNAYNKTKNAVTGTSSNSSNYSTSSYTPSYAPTQPQSTYSVGGRSRKNKRGGSYMASKSVSGLAASASPVSNVKTAQPHNMIGGKKSRRHHKRAHKHTKTCKH